MKKAKVNFSIKSIRGRRKTNQDWATTAFNFNKEFCAVVCDGVGSVAGSENASRIIANKFADEFAKTGHIDKPTQWFRDTLKLALNDLEKFVKENNMHGIATTLAAVLIIRDKFYCYNIGDTRIYAFQKHEKTHSVKQYSYDHNYKNYLISSGASADIINANQVRWYSLTNYIDADKPRAAKFEANSGTVDYPTYFLICTDGQYSYVRDNDKYEIVTRKYLPLAMRLNILNQHALKNGSTDNITGVLAFVK